MIVTKKQYIKELNRDVEFDIECEWVEGENCHDGVDIISIKWDRSIYTKTQNLVIEECVDYSDFNIEHTEIIDIYDD